MAFVWVLIGIVYIIYKLHKEEHVFTKDLILPGIIFVAVNVFLVFLDSAASDGDETAAIVGIVSMILILLAIFVFVVYAICSSIEDKASQPKPDQDGFISCGYPKVDQECIDELNEKRARHKDCISLQSMDGCYRNMCRDEIIRLQYVSEFDIQKQIGVPLLLLPKYNGRYYSLLTKPSPDKEHITAIRGFLCHQKGLYYADLSGYPVHNTNDFEEYVQDLSRFISQYKQDYGSAQVSKITIPESDKRNAQLLQLRFKNYAYGTISIPVIQNLISNPQSPLNNGKDSDPSIDSCYSWMCWQAFSELDKLTREELSEKIGFSIDQIPFNPKPSHLKPDSDRAVYVINYILNKDGLKYYDPFVIKNKDYAMMVKEFIETKNKEISQITTA